MLLGAGGHGPFCPTLDQCRRLQGAWDWRQAGPLWVSSTCSPGRVLTPDPVSSEIHPESPPHRPWTPPRGKGLTQGHRTKLFLLSSEAGPRKSLSAHVSCLQETCSAALSFFSGSVRLCSGGRWAARPFGEKVLRSGPQSWSQQGRGPSQPGPRDPVKLLPSVASRGAGPAAFAGADGGSSMRQGCLWDTCHRRTPSPRPR